jgi:hypothetical protein
LSASVGDYEVGVAKSATNLLLNAVIPKVDSEKIKFIERLIANSMTPSIEQALLYDFWKTREVKTSSGTFTVPSNVYAVGIFCLGAGGNGTSSVLGGGGGGLAMKIKKVNPGDAISYTISSGIATCDGMTANPANVHIGGTASGGMYSYSGGTSASTNKSYGGGGCGGNDVGTPASNCYGGTGMRHWAQGSAPALGYSNGSEVYGGGGMMLTNAVLASIAADGTNTHGGFGFGAAPTRINTSGSLSAGVGRAPLQLGIIVTSDITQNNTVGVTTPSGFSATSVVMGDWNGGSTAVNGGSICPGGGLGAGGAYGPRGGAGGLGGGGGRMTEQNGGAGGLGGGGGYGSSTGGVGGFGAGGAAGGAGGGAGGSSVVIFVF